MSEWYEIVEGVELFQGDVIRDCTVFYPPEDISYPIQDEDHFITGTEDVVVMSQSCDLVSGRDNPQQLVILCPIWPLEVIEVRDNYLRSTYGKEQCRRGHTSGYHMISGFENDALGMSISLVSFRDIWTLPQGFLEKVVAERNPRLRLKPPYREHLAQAFARYFMRVGLPSDIPRFQVSASESKCMQWLESMTPQERKGLISAFPDG